MAADAAIGDRRGETVVINAGEWPDAREWGGDAGRRIDFQILAGDAFVDNEDDIPAERSAGLPKANGLALANVHRRVLISGKRQVSDRSEEHTSELQSLRRI